MNIYAFSPDEEQQACCSCPVSPNGLIAFPVYFGFTAILGNPFVFKPTSPVVKLVATGVANGTGPGPCTTSINTGGQGTSVTITAASITGANLVPGMVAWGSRAHPTNVPGLASLTETKFAPKALTQAG